jgi:hypothetical protein
MEKASFEFAGRLKEVDAVISPTTTQAARRYDAWAEATFASDPVGSMANPQNVRASNGSVKDGRLFWSAGKPVYNPELITVPALC